MTVKVGQVYKLPYTKSPVVVTRIEPKKEERFDFIHFITDDGKQERLWRIAVEERLELLAEYDSWIKAVNSPEFKGEK